MQPKLKILVICRHNNGRSQIAAAYLKRLVGEFYDIESAGLEPAEKVNPLVVEVMKEEGFDLSENKPQSVFELCSVTPVEGPSPSRSYSSPKNGRTMK